MMADLHFAGVNVWTYSDRRAIVWLGARGSHWSGRRHVGFELGSVGRIGAEVAIGGEDGGGQFVLGLLLATLYISVDGRLVSNRERYREKLERETKRQRRCPYELDWADEGRRTGAMLSFGDCGGLTLHLWNSDMWSSNRPFLARMRGFPFCEGWSTGWYWEFWIGWQHEKQHPDSPEETHSYRYILEDGTVQDRQATINETAATWRRWWSIPRRKIVRSINVRFDDEVGERTGSWKGGVTGCGYTMLDHESPIDTLRRMERERVFR